MLLSQGAGGGGGGGGGFSLQLGPADRKTVRRAKCRPAEPGSLVCLLISAGDVDPGDDASFVLPPFLHDIHSGHRARLCAETLRDAGQAWRMRPQVQRVHYRLNNYTLRLLSDQICADAQGSAMAAAQQTSPCTTESLCVGLSQPLPPPQPQPQPQLQPIRNVEAELSSLPHAFGPQQLSMEHSLRITQSLLSELRHVCVGADSTISQEYDQWPLLSPSLEAAFLDRLEAEGESEALEAHYRLLVHAYFTYVNVCVAPLQKASEGFLLHFWAAPLPQRAQMWDRLVLICVGGGVPGPGQTPGAAGHGSSPAGVEMISGHMDLVRVHCFPMVGRFMETAGACGHCEERYVAVKQLHSALASLVAMQVWLRWSEGRHGGAQRQRRTDGKSQRGGRRRYPPPPLEQWREANRLRQRQTT